MTFESSEAWWWPFLFILVAGWLATDSWRFLGVFLGGRISQESPSLVLVRTIATALVAGVIGNLVVFPGGALAQTSFALRIGAVGAGFAFFLATRKRLFAGIAATEVVLCLGMALGL